ncbi:tetratricopeptide repeat protein [Marinoscillum sp.]|uniref:tetratricopeptide repeat protein n=1 Tax=Marinoscillum sp. TaxID=2024838 RepID=UPI003BAB0B5D
MKYPIAIGLLFALVATSCLETQSSQGQQQPVDQPVISNPTTNPNQVLSLSGAILPEKQLSDRIKEKREEQLEEARINYETQPDSLDNIIWYGRRLAYLGRYNDAIRMYSVGLDLYPNSYKLLRHRGHRYITIRQFDKAIEDLQKAAFYARPVRNSIEPDGLPNRLNKPLSNDKFNIWYHLGIAYYLKGNYDKAISSFKQCMEYADNDDLVVATSNWFYMTYKKIGNETAANDLLKPINKRMEIIEYTPYHQLLLMHKEVYNVVTILDYAQSENNSIDPTLGYGVANYYSYSNQVDLAKDLFERILRNPAWDSFGYIATEVDNLSLQNL